MYGGALKETRLVIQCFHYQRFFHRYIVDANLILQLHIYLLMYVYKYIRTVYNN